MTDRRWKSIDFLGGETIKKQLAEGVTKRRVGFFATGPPARQHALIYTADGKKKIGEITSGAFSPCLDKSIAMGYVEKGNDKAGTKVMLEVRGKMNEATVAKMPFVQTHYFKG